MNKKYIKLFAVSALTFFASLSLVSAKSYTKLEDLVKDVETWREKENKENNEDVTDGYIYIVGNYVFTSNYTFETLNDLADAWQTIPDGNKTYIYQINRTYDDNYEPTGWDIEGKTNLFNNSAKLPETIDAYYFDTELTDDAVRTDDDVKLLVEKANAAVKNPENESIYGAYELSFDDEEHVITVNVKKDLTLDKVSHSDVVATLYSILNRGTYSSVKVGSQTINARNVTTTSIKNALTNALTYLESVDSLIDLATKSIKVVFTPARGLSNVSVTNEYTIKFTAEVDTNTYFSNASTEWYALSCESNGDELCTPVINVLKEGNFYGLSAVASTIKNALNNGSKKVTLTITNVENNEEPTVLNYTKLADVDNFKAALKKAIGSNYSDLKKFEMSIKFEADTDNGYTFANRETEVIYDFAIGSYIDLNKVILDNSKDSNYELTISEDGKTININFPLVDNSLKSGHELELDFVSLAKVLNAVSTAVGENGKVTINGKEYTKTNGDDNNQITDSLRTILKEYIGTNVYDEMTLDKLLAIPKITIVVTKDVNDEFIPTAINVSGDKATYEIKLAFTKANLSDIVSEIAETNGSNHYSAEYVAKNLEAEILENTLTVDLKNVDDKVSTIIDKAVSQALKKYTSILKSVTIGETTLDLTKSAEAIDDQIIAALNITDDTVLQSLIGKSYVVKMTLVDGIMPETEGENVLEFTLKFISNAVVSLNGAANEKSLAELVGTNSVAEIIYLNKDYVVPNEGTLTIAKENLVIKGDGESAITGNVKVTANNVTIDNVVITGVNNLGSTANIETPVFVIDASSAVEFTLTNSTLSYDKSENTHYAYGMVKVGGLVTIKNNTIDITNVKNPIEFDQTSLAKDGTEISGNTFTGNNYAINKAEDALSIARNVISIYGVETNNATINIEGNKFEYANWAVRISNNNENMTAVYNITNNKVTTNKAYTKDGEGTNVLVSDGETAFVGIQSKVTKDSTKDVSKVIINYKDNYVNGSLVEHIKEKYNDNKYNGFDRFAYTDAAGNQATINKIR